MDQYHCILASPSPTPNHARVPAPPLRVHASLLRKVPFGDMVLRRLVMFPILVMAAGVRCVRRTMLERHQATGLRAQVPVGVENEVSI